MKVVLGAFHDKLGVAGTDEEIRIIKEFIDEDNKNYLDCPINKNLDNLLNSVPLLYNITRHDENTTVMFVELGIIDLVSGAFSEGSSWLNPERYAVLNKLKKKLRTQYNKAKQKEQEILARGKEAKAKFDAEMAEMGKEIEQNE